MEKPFLERYKEIRPIVERLKFFQFIPSKRPDIFSNINSYLSFKSSLTHLAYLLKNTKTLEDQIALYKLLGSGLDKAYENTFIINAIIMGKDEDLSEGLKKIKNYFLKNKITDYPVYESIGSKVGLDDYSLYKDALKVYEKIADRTLESRFEKEENLKKLITYLDEMLRASLLYKNPLDKTNISYLRKVWEDTYKSIDNEDEKFKEKMADRQVDRILSRLQKVLYHLNNKNYSELFDIDSVSITEEYFTNQKKEYLFEMLKSIHFAFNPNLKGVYSRLTEEIFNMNSTEELLNYLRNDMREVYKSYRLVEEFNRRLPDTKYVNASLLKYVINEKLGNILESKGIKVNSKGIKMNSIEDFNKILSFVLKNENAFNMVASAFKPFKPRNNKENKKAEDIAEDIDNDDVKIKTNKTDKEDGDRPEV